MARVKIFTPEIAEFINRNYRGITTKDLTKLVNDLFEAQFTNEQVRSYKSRNKLRTGMPKGNPVGYSKLWPPEIRMFMEENQAGVSGMNMAALVNAEFGTNYTPQQTEAYYGNHGLNSGLSGHFTKGHTPFYKGRKGIRLSPATEFKPGRMPHNHLPVGTELIKGDGYTWVKIADPKTWRQKHLLIWEEAYGPVPEGHVIIFTNGDRQDVRLDNLTLVTRSQLVRLNQNKLISRDPDATRVGIVVVDIITKITERRRGE